MADAATSIVSIAAIGATAAVAIYTIRAQGAEAAKSRQHAWELAREERMQARRAEAYTETLRFLHAAEAIVEDILPIFKPADAPEPPPPLSSAEIWQVQAKLEAFGSGEMQQLLEEWGASRREFQNRAEVLVQMQAEQQRSVLPSEIKETWGRLPTEQWQYLEEARQQLRDKVREIAKRANDELRGS